MMLRVMSRRFTCISPVGTIRLACSGKSLAVTTALTPGSFSAFEVSIDLMMACGWGLRSTLPISWPGRLKSAPKRARPVTLSAPSGRSGRVPIHLYLGLPSGICASLHFGGHLHDRSDDLVVTGAAAEIAGQPVA